MKVSSSADVCCRSGPSPSGQAVSVVSFVIVLQFASTSLSQKAKVIRLPPDRLPPDSKLYEPFKRLGRDFPKASRAQAFRSHGIPGCSESSNGSNRLQLPRT